MTASYLDASALVKLVALERESHALRDHLVQYERLLTSRLVSVEVSRALARRGPASVRVGAEQVARVFEHLMLIEIDAAVASVAAQLEPPGLRSLDAIHLASALAVGNELVTMITYDVRLASAARTMGLTVVAPA